MKTARTILKSIPTDGLTSDVASRIGEAIATRSPAVASCVISSLLRDQNTAKVAFGRSVTLALLCAGAELDKLQAMDVPVVLCADCAKHNALPTTNEQVKPRQRYRRCFVCGSKIARA